MPEKVVTVELCEAKHGELMRGMSHIETKVDSILTMLNGNGRPGFRETQNDVAALHEAVTSLQQKQESEIKHKENVFWNFVKPALPVFYGLCLYLLWLALDYQFGVK